MGSSSTAGSNTTASPNTAAGSGTAAGSNTAADSNAAAGSDLATAQSPKADSAGDALEACASAQLVKSEALPWLTKKLGCEPEDLGRIDVVVSKRSERRQSRQVHAHAWSAGISNDQVIKLRDHLYVCSPESVFLQMADCLPLLDLVRLGHQMCGRYSLADGAGGFVKHPAITTIAQLETYLAGIPKGTRGIKKARRALRLMHNNSWSPMETVTAMLLSMPRRMGGFGLPSPRLNHRIELDRNSSQVGGQENIYVDLLWPDAKFGIEYNGEAYHRNTSRDLRRELTLRKAQLNVVTLGIQQVRDQVQFREVVSQAAEHLGVKLRRATPLIAKKRTNLLAALLPHGTIQRNGSVCFPKPPWSLPARIAQSWT
ncbi:MAG: hypothetical protein ACI4B6_03180 [Atopobiaceae bacterium]